MDPARDDEPEVEHLQKLLSRMSEAFLDINQNLDFTAVLQDVLDIARSLIGARYGMLTLSKSGQQGQDRLASGLSPGQAERICGAPEYGAFFEHFGLVEEPLRVPDLCSHIRRLGLPQFRLPMPVSPSLAALACPLCQRDERMGTFILLEKEGGTTFTPEDEKTLMMFASHAALAITNARRHREEQRARADLEALIRTTPVSVAVFNALTGEMISTNRETERLLNVVGLEKSPLEEILKIVKVRRADGRELFSEQLSATKLLESAGLLRSEEIIIEGPNDTITALVNMTAIRSDDGTVTSLIVTVQDRTHLEELEQQRSDFLGIVSHELRAPLAAIKGSAATVLGDSLALGRSEMLQFFRIINQHADQMSSLVNDLSDVARIRTGTLQVNPESVGVTTLVDRARITFAGGGGKNDVLIELAPDLPPVSADRRRIDQVLVNLLSNADRHSPEDTPLRITAWQEGMHVAFCVIDKGRGISAQRLPDLFRKIEPYDQNEGDGKAEGTGWGLSICKGIVEAHGGRIWVESDGVGQGTRVTFTIPVAENAGDMPLGVSASNAGDELSGRHTRTPVLVVDDDPQTLRNVREALSKVGFTPVTTGDPDEVPALLEQHRPQLALLDLVLPGTDGIEMMQTVFKDADIPVVFFSAYAHEEAIDQALAAGAVDYVVKPCSATELVSRIRVALRKAKMSFQNRQKTPFVLGDLTIDYARGRVTLGKRDVRLTVTEYRLLVELSTNPGGILTHEHLLQTVWRKQRGDTRSLRSAIKSLRRKLGDKADNPTYIFNQPRVGYRLGENL